MRFTAHPYDRHFQEALDDIAPSLSVDLSAAAALSAMKADRVVALVLKHACSINGTHHNLRGREAAGELPRDWFVERLERVANETLDLDRNHWEYRRLLDLAETFDPSFLARLIRRGLTSHHPEIVKAANDFQSKQSA
jgi:hypothetical protein